MIATAHPRVLLLPTDLPRRDKEQRLKDSDEKARILSTMSDAEKKRRRYCLADTLNILGCFRSRPKHGRNNYQAWLLF